MLLVWQTRVGHMITLGQYRTTGAVQNLSGLKYRGGEGIH